MPGVTKRQNHSIKPTRLLAWDRSNSNLSSVNRHWLIITKENSAEHSWHLANVRVDPKRQLERNINLDRLIKSSWISWHRWNRWLAIIPSTNHRTIHFKEEAERKAAERYFWLLQPSQGEELQQPSGTSLRAAESHDRCLLRNHLDLY